MSDSIFAVELPLVDSDEDLEKIKNIYDRYDSYFIASGCCKERKELFDKLWVKIQNLNGLAMKYLVGLACSGLML